MAYDGGRSRTYVLGRECVLEIEGQEVTGAADVSVRETVSEIDATAFNAQTQATIVTQRSYEIVFSCPDMTQARRIFALREGARGDFFVPAIVMVRLSGGLIQFAERVFTIHGVEADEPIDGAVIPRFTLREWYD